MSRLEAMARGWMDGLAPFSRVILLAAVLVHLIILGSWRAGYLNPLFFDSTVAPNTIGFDFYALYQAGHNVLTGYSVYGNDGYQEIVVPVNTPFRYLPFTAYTLGVALNLIPTVWAFRLWVIVIECALLACVALIWRAAPDPNVAARVSALWLAFSPYYLEIVMGQFSTVQAVLILVMLVLILRKRPGVRFAFAWITSVLWKANTLLWIPVMLRLRAWRTLAALLAAILVTSIPYFVLYPASFNWFLLNFQPQPPGFLMGNLGFRQWMSDAIWYLQPGLEDNVYAGVLLVGTLVFVLTPLALLLLDRAPDPLDHLCLWLTAFFFVYHDIWEHHYIMLLPVLTVQLFRHPRSRALWLAGLWLALPTPYILIDPHGLAALNPAVRWTPVSPPWLDLWYHASKILPAAIIYAHLCLGIVRKIRYTPRLVPANVSDFVEPA